MADTLRAAAPEARVIHFGARAIPYTLKRSARRSLGLRVDGRGLTVSIPWRATLRETEHFLRQHGAWIVDKLAEHAAQPAPAALEIADGLRFPLLGQACVLRLLPGAARAQWLEGLDGRELRLPLRPHGDARLLLRRVLQQYALTYFAGRLDEYLWRLHAHWPHIERPPLALSSARTRWGSCSRRSGIRLNWRLLFLAPELADYVVAHEVAHLVEMNHSPRFWAVVEMLYPDWRRARQALAEQGKAVPLL